MFVFGGMPELEADIPGTFCFRAIVALRSARQVGPLLVQKTSLAPFFASTVL